MLKNGEKTQGYLMIPKESIGTNLINIKTIEDKTCIVALTEELTEVKVLLDVLNDEDINGCVVDYSDILQNPLGVGGLVYVDTYIRKDGVITFFSSTEWGDEEIITVKHKED